MITCLIPFTTMPATVLIMLLILLVSGASLYRTTLFLKLILHPFSVVKKKEYWRPLTSGLVHNDILHLVVNEIMIFFICGDLEKCLKARSPFGSLQMLFIYLFSHLAGAAVITARYRNDFDYSSAGASGSVLGCMMCFMMVSPNYIALYLPVVGGVKNIFAGLIVIIGLIVYQRRTGNRMMDHELHFYSAVGGIAGTLMLFPHLIF